MYINDIHILYYVGIGLLGGIIGQFIDWCNLRLPEYKKVFSKEFFSIYLRKCKPNYWLILITSVLFISLLYYLGMGIELIKYLTLIPMLLSVVAIDYKLKIIPNRLNLTIFEVGLLFTCIQGIFNINIAIDMLLGMIVGAGIFLIITLIGGIIAGKEAMGFGDVKLMGALGLFFGWINIIVISIIAFLLGAVISILLIVTKKKSTDEYIPFGPFIVMSAIIVTLIPFEVLLPILLKIFTLGMYKG